MIKWHVPITEIPSNKARFFYLSLSNLKPSIMTHYTVVILMHQKESKTKFTLM